MKPAPPVTTILTGSFLSWAGEDRYSERTDSRKRRTVRWAISALAW
jgi:hypothetical protein